MTLFRHLLRISGILVLGFLLSTSFVSCGQDEPTEPTDEIHDPNLIGTWFQADSEEWWERITFRANGTGRIEASWPERGDNKVPAWGEFMWSGANGYLIWELMDQSYDDEFEEMNKCRYHVIGNLLYLNFDDGDEAVFIKQK